MLNESAAKDVLLQLGLLPQDQRVQEDANTSQQSHPGFSNNT